MGIKDHHQLRMAMVFMLRKVLCVKQGKDLDTTYHDTNNEFQSTWI